MFVADQRLHLRQQHRVLEEALGNLIIEQPVAIERERRVVPHRLVHDGWTRGVLSFDREPLEDTVAELARYLPEQVKSFRRKDGKDDDNDDFHG